MHRTLKQETASPPARTLRAQQRAFDRFRREYNEERPHQGLELKTPGECYGLSPRPYPSRIEEPVYPAEFALRRVVDGVIRWRRQKVFVGKGLNGERVGLEQIGERLWRVWFSFYELGWLDERQGRLSPPGPEGAGARPMFLGDRTLTAVKGYLTFGFLFEPNPIDVSSPEWLIWLSAILPWLALLLLGAGVFARKTKVSATLVNEPRAPTLAVLGIATVASCVVILFAIDAAGTVFPHKATLLRLTVPLPLSAFVFAWSVRFFAGRRTNRFLWMRRVSLRFEHDRLLVFLMATVPLFLIAALSQLVPFFAPRAMLLFTPFLLILLAYGVSFVTTEKRKASVVAAGVLLVLLGIAHAASVRSSLSFPGPADYKAAALGLLDELEESDWIFLRRHWATTPIFYYLKGEDRRFIADHFAAALDRRPDARVWVIRPDYLQMPGPMEDALRDRRQSDGIVAHSIRVDLYDP